MRCRVCSASLALFHITASLNELVETGPGKTCRSLHAHTQRGAHHHTRNIEEKATRVCQVCKHTKIKGYSLTLGTNADQTTNTHTPCRWTHVNACAHKHTLTHTNQYAEPEPLRSLITASFTAAGFNAFIFYFSLPLKFTEKWLSEESNLFRSLWKAASAINLIRDMLYFNEKTQPVLQFLHILLHHIDTSH